MHRQVLMCHAFRSLTLFCLNWYFVDRIYGFFPLISWSPGAVVGRGGCSKNNSGPLPPPPAATLKEAAGLAGILRRILPFHCFRPLFLFFSELQDTKAGKKKTHTQTDTLTQKQLQIALNWFFFSFFFLHSPTSRGVGGGTRTLFFFPFIKV